MKRRIEPSGFTLIELLVVIAIVTILAAILFPVFAKAREKARQAVCASGMQQVGIALIMYIQDYDEVYPEEHPPCKNPAVGSFPPVHGGQVGDYNAGLENTDFGSPFEKIIPYIQSENSTDTVSQKLQLYVCPDDEDPHGNQISSTGQDLTAGATSCAAGVAAGATPEPGVTSYLINAYFLFGVSDASIPDPSETIYIAERNFNFCDVHVHPWLGEVWDAPGDTGAILGQTAVSPCDSANPAIDGNFAIQSNRHTNGANYTFADGHVKWETYNTTITPNPPDQSCFGQYQALPAAPGP